MPSLCLSSFFYLLSHHSTGTLLVPSFAVSVGLEELLVHLTDFPVGVVDQLGISSDVLIEFLQFLLAYRWLNTYYFLVESDIVLRESELLLPLLIFILQCEPPPPEVALTGCPVTRPPALYSHKRLHQLLIMIKPLLLNLLLVILFEDGEIVVLLLVGYGRLRAEEFQVVRGAVQDVVVVARPAIFYEGVHALLLFLCL